MLNILHLKYSFWGLLLLHPTIAFSEVFVMGVVEAPPLIILDKEGEPPQGIVINRLESIFTSAGLELQYLPLTTARVNKELNDGKVDGFPLFFGNQFQQFSELKFSDVYYKLPVYLWCSPKTCTSPKDLESIFDNKRLILGVRKYAKYGESVNLVIKEFSGRIYESRNDNTLIDLLYSGKIDIMFTFSSTIAQYRKNNNLDNVFIRSHSPFYIAEYRIIFSEKDASNKLLQDINTAIEKVQ